MNDNSVQNPLLKGLTALIFSIFGSWSEAAAFLATIYTGLLILEWLYKRFKTFIEWRRVKRGDDAF